MADPSDALIDSARRRLAVVTLSLLVLLVATIAVITAVAGLRALDDDVDRALDSTATAAVARLEGELPAASSEGDAEEVHPASADTFLLYVDLKGRVVSDPGGVSLPGLPDPAALASAGSSGRDLRTVETGDTQVRLLTLPIVAEGGRRVGFVQAGFVLTLHVRQSVSLVATIAVVALLGLLGAGVVTLIVTRRALVPIRRTFDAQRGIGRASPG